MKKIFVLFLVFGVFFAFSPMSINAKTYTMSDLYNQIEILQKQINKLQSQLQSLAIESISRNDLVAPISDEEPVNIVVNQPINTTGQTAPPTTPIVPVVPLEIAPVMPSVPDVKTTKSTVESNKVDNTPIVSSLKNSNQEIVTTTKMTLGSKGPNVLALQKILINIGYLSGKADGSFGKKTAAAVKLFEVNNKLVADGIADAKMITLLNSKEVPLVTTNPCMKDRNGNHSPSLKIISPNGGEAYTLGQQINVKWSSCGISTTSNVKIILQDLSGTLSGFPVILSSNTVNDGEEIVTFPVVSGYLLKIKIESITTIPFSDISDNTFSVLQQTWNHVSSTQNYLGCWSSFVLGQNGTHYMAYSDINTNHSKVSVLKFNGINWTNLGISGFSEGMPSYISTALFEGFSNEKIVPYVAFNQQTSTCWGNSCTGTKAVAMKYDANTNSWGYLGTSGISTGATKYVSIAINSVGVPYVAFKDLVNLNKATVMKYDSISNSWSTVGIPGISFGEANFVSIAIDLNNVLYLAYDDVVNGNKSTVMKFNGTSWVHVGNPGFTPGIAIGTRLALDSNNLPYVAFKDGANLNKVSVMKFNGTSWVYVGNPGFTLSPIVSTLGQPGYESQNISLDLDLNNTPYVAFPDGGSVLGYATVMKFNGTSWVQVGNSNFSTSSENINISINNNGIPYVGYCRPDLKKLN